MSVKAIFSVTTIVTGEGPKTGYVELWLEAISGANGKDLERTNEGRLEMRVLNSSDFNQFELGKEYYVTFERVEHQVTPAPKAEGNVIKIAGEWVDPKFYFKD